MSPHLTSLRVRLILAAIAVAAVPLGLFAVIAAQRQADLATDTAFIRLEGQASAQTARLTQILSADLEVATLLAEDPGLRLAMAQGPVGETNFLTERTASLDIRSVVRLESGRAITGVPAAALERFDSGMISPTSPIVAVDTGGASPSGFVHVAIPGFAGSDGTGRSLLVEFDLADVTELGRDYSGLSATGETSVAQRNADGSASFVAPLRFRDDAVLNIEVPAHRTDMPVIRAVNGEPARFTDTVDYRNEPVLAVTRSEPVSGWGVVVKMDRAEALDSVGQYRSALVGALVAGVGLAALFAMFLGTRLVRPIRDVVAMTRRIGGGDLDGRIDSRRGDEVGDLARAVDRMAGRLRAADHAARVREAEIGSMHTRMRAVFDGAADAILDVDDGFVVVEANPAAEDLFGAEVVGQPVARLFLPGMRATDPRDPLVRLVEVADAAGEDEPGTDRSSEACRLLVAGDHGLRHLTVSASWHRAADARGLTLIARDETDRIAHQRALRYQASHDALTGLANRTEIVRRLEQALDDDAPLAVFFVDLDRFKMVNDTQGHAVGDEVLRQTADRLRNLTREADEIARYGGDEFVILCRSCDADQMALATANRLVRALSEPIETGIGPIRLSVSIGVVPPSALECDASEALIRADLAMYRAKDRGRDRYAIYTPDLASAQARRNTLELALRKAIEDGAVDLHYQPVVDLASGSVAGFEALARWELDGQMVSPAEFIPLAEETGLIVPLGRQLLRRAMHATHGWQSRHPGCRVAVNLSARELAEDDLVDAVSVLLGESGVDPALVTLEITETAVMENLGDAVRTLDALRGMGLRISLDDFGTGFSSLSHLRQLPVDTVKIDRTFIAELDDISTTASVVDVVLGLGASLGLFVVAEGIETDAQAVAYRSAGGSFAQGYRFSKPLPLADALDAIPGIHADMREIAALPDLY